MPAKHKYPLTAAVITDSGVRSVVGVTDWQVSSHCDILRDITDMQDIVRNHLDLLSELSDMPTTMVAGGECDRKGLDGAKENGKNGKGHQSIVP